MATGGQSELVHMQHILCADAQSVARDNEKKFRRLKQMKPKVDKCLADFHNGRASNRELKQVLQEFADAQMEYTKSFQRAIDLIPDDDADTLVQMPAPNKLAIPTQDPTPPISPPEYSPQELGVQVRPDGAQRQLQTGLQSDNNPQPSACASGGLPHPGDDGPGGPGGGGHQQNGSCMQCVRNVLARFGEAVSAFFHLVVTFFQAVLSYICQACGKLKEFALWVLQRIAELWGVCGMWVADRSNEVAGWLEDMRHQPALIVAT